MAKLRQQLLNLLHELLNNLRYLLNNLLKNIQKVIAGGRSRAVLADRRRTDIIGLLSLFRLLKLLKAKILLLMASSISIRRYGELAYEKNSGAKLDMRREASRERSYRFKNVTHDKTSKNQIKKIDARNLSKIQNTVFR